MWIGARWRSSQCRGGGSCQGKTTGGVVKGCVLMVISRYVEVIGGVGVDEVA